jgi:hypothetical protein
MLADWKVEQAAVRGFRQHPTTMLCGLEGAWIERA